MNVSVKIILYNFFVRAFIPYVTSPAGVIRYGLTPLQVTALNDFLASWILKFDVYISPLTHDTPSTLDINEAYLFGFPLTEGIRMSIKANTTITLSGIERMVLNIRKPAPRKSHLKPQADGPVFVCIGTGIGSFMILAVDPKNPRVFGKPGGADIGLKVAFTPIGSGLPKPDDFTRLPDETTAVFELIVSSANAGKLMSLKGTYLNARGEEGNEGIVFMMLV